MKKKLRILRETSLRDHIAVAIAMAARRWAADVLDDGEWMPNEEAMELCEFFAQRKKEVEDKVKKDAEDKAKKEVDEKVKKDAEDQATRPAPRRLERCPAPRDLERCPAPPRTASPRPAVSKSAQCNRPQPFCSNRPTLHP